MPRSITVALLLIAFATLCWLGLALSVKNIEKDIYTRASTALEAAGLRGLEVDVDGRDVRLSGMLPHQDDLAKALKAVSDVWGVRTVDGIMVEVTVSPGSDELTRKQAQVLIKDIVAASTGQREAKPTSEYSLSITTDGASVLVSGSLPSNEDIQALRGSIVSRFANVPVKMNVTANSSPLPPAQRGLELFGVEQLSHLAEGALTIDATAFSLKGQAASQGKLNTINRGIERLQSLQPTLNIATDLRVAQEMGGSVCQRQIDDIMKGQRIEFSTGRAQISQKSFDVLNAITAIVKRCDILLEISGHTDSQGSDAANRYLSERRALAVERYFLLRNVAPKKLTAVGIGEMQPIADNSTPEGRAQNRRIEFRVIKGAQ